ncbi:hypothetical protein MBLNU459_g7014t1 [Dothideomycetes sp. NU459]
MPPKASLVEGGATKNLRKGSKSRTGCQNCKVKRLKCDETKPECANCTKRGVTCPGYRQSLRWSTKYETLRVGAESSQALLHPSIEHQFSSLDPLSFGQADASIPTADSGSAELPPTETRTATLDVTDQNRDHAELEHLSRFDDPNHASSSINSSNDDLFVDAACAWQNGVPIPHDHGTQIVPFEASTRNFSDQQLERVEHTEHDVQIIHRQDRSNDSAQWRSLLRNYYRISTPTMSRELQTEATALVEHYFRDVCVVFSAFDSAMNPFRTVIARLWDNSSSIFYAIQSMAAAHLANYVPNMKVKGLTMQRKAYECLQNELQLASINRTMDDKLLLTVLLLGLTACWHDSSDLGSAHLAAARALIHPRLLRDDTLQNAESTRNDQFFAEALIYWEMCMAFVSQEAFAPGTERRLPSGSSSDDQITDRKVFPHPWTGIAPRVQMLFAEVGRLVRHQCNTKMMLLSIPILEDGAATVSAMELEQELLSIRLPRTDDLIDVQDERTSKADFISIAEATRCAALLEIYRVFPTILSSRLATAEGVSAAAPSATSTFFNFAQPLHPSAPDDSHSHSHTSWLTSLANHILDLLASVPSSSGTRPLQLILLATAASELRLSGPSVSSPGLCESTSYDVDVARARGFAMARLHELAARLPSKPVLRIIELVREVWRRNDAGDDVFWMDVMTANGWETIMG